MIELVILDLVLLLGIAVVPRHASRSYLAIRRIAKEGLREATRREPLSAPAAIRGAVARAARSAVARAARSAGSAVYGFGLRPALLPTAAALVAVAGIAGYAAWSDTAATEFSAEAAASRASFHYLPFAGFGEQGGVEAPAAPRIEVACEDRSDLREPTVRTLRTTRAAAAVSAGLRGLLHLESREALEAARPLSVDVRIRIL